MSFYTEKPGLKVAVDAELPPGEQRWIELEIPGGDTIIVLFTPEGHEDLKGKGVEFHQEFTEESWGTFAIFKDPDGNTFCLSST